MKCDFFLGKRLVGVEKEGVLPPKLYLVVFSSESGDENKHLFTIQSLEVIHASSGNFLLFFL